MHAKRLKDLLWIFRDKYANVSSKKIVVKIVKKIMYMYTEIVVKTLALIFPKDGHLVGEICFKDVIISKMPFQTYFLDTPSNLIIV